MDLDRRRGGQDPPIFDPRAAPGSLFRGAGDLGLELAADLETVNRDLTTALSQGDGLEGIVRTLHRMTQRTVVIWDANGLPLAAWGETGATSLPRHCTRANGDASPDDHARARREGDHLVAVCCPAGEILGSVTMADADDSATTGDIVALEMATSVLAVELFRLRSIAEAEVRLWGDLTSELLADGDVDRMCEHARALGYDVTHQHRSVVITARADDLPEVAAAVRRSARLLDLEPGLLALRGDHAVLLVDGDRDWTMLAQLLDAEASGRRIGVGGLHPPGEFGTSLDEAKMALQLIDRPLARYEALGVWRFLSPQADASELRAFIDHWIGSLVCYDEVHDSDFVDTLSVYLRLGGAAAAAARQLHIHTSTLKYRLARIGEVTGRDLHDPEERFNLDLACRAHATLSVLGRGTIHRAS